jgi:hypothetical protein
MGNSPELSLLFGPALERLKRKEFTLSALEFEAIFATASVPYRTSSDWAYILGCYIACCYALKRQPNGLTAFDVKAFVDSQDIAAVHRAALACVSEFEGEAEDAVSTYLLIVAGRNGSFAYGKQSSTYSKGATFDIDRAEIRQRVEGYWRGLILSARHIGEATGTGERAKKEMQNAQSQLAASFDAETAVIVGSMGAQNVQAYMSVLTEELDSIGNQYEADHDAVYRKLGLPFQHGILPASTSGYRRQNIGEMAVRTAVRATIWETVRLAVRAIFR